MKEDFYVNAYSIQGDPRKTKRFQRLITLSLLVAKTSYLRRRLILDKRFLFAKVPSEFVEYEGNANGSKENFPICGIWPNPKLQPFSISHVYNGFTRDSHQRNPVSRAIFRRQNELLAIDREEVISL